MLILEERGVHRKYRVRQIRLWPGRLLLEVNTGPLYFSTCLGRPGLIFVGPRGRMQIMLIDKSFVVK